MLSTWTLAGTSLVAASHAVCCSNKSIVKESSSIVSSLLKFGEEAGDPSDGPSKLSSKELNKFRCTTDYNTTGGLITTWKRQCYFLVSLLYMLVNALLSPYHGTQVYISGGCQNNVVCYLKCPL